LVWQEHTYLFQHRGACTFWGGLINMTQNTAVIDHMNKCLINLSPDFGCITIANVIMVFGIGALVSLILYIILKKFTYVE